MKRLLMVGLPVGLAAALTVGGSPRHPAEAQVGGAVHPKRREYEAIHAADEPFFNRLGDEGWELCAAIGPYSTTNAALSFLFKRTQALTNLAGEIRWHRPPSAGRPSTTCIDSTAMPS